MPFNPEEFQKSINKELILVKDRVENLINIRTNHNGEDGSYREAILKNVIKRFLPNNLSIGTGFVISNANNEIKRTTQIDIIVYDNTYPLLFKEGDFIITTPKNVKAIIEVKTSIQNSRNGDNGIYKIIEKATSNYDIIKQEGKDLFNGIFSFNYEDNIIDGRNNNLSSVIKDSLNISRGKVNHISLGEKNFIKYWHNETNPRINEVCITNNFYNLYELNDLSFSYFISNLIDWVIDESIHEREWFMFPISSEDGKENHKLTQHCIINQI